MRGRGYSAGQQGGPSSMSGGCTLSGVLRMCACGQLAPKRGVCPGCGVDTRASSSSRGYGAAWRRGPRARQLRLQPWCVWRYKDGSVCGLRATDVDHIIRRRDGGPDRAPNLQSLCHKHHSTKTAAEVNEDRRKGRTPPPTPPSRYGAVRAATQGRAEGEGEG